MNGFGMCHIKAEGHAIHPDDAEMSNEFYLKQLQAYADWRGVDETVSEGCVRPALLAGINTL